VAHFKQAASTMGSGILRRPSRVSSKSTADSKLVEPPVEAAVELSTAKAQALVGPQAVGEPTVSSKVVAAVAKCENGASEIVGSENVANDGSASANASASANDGSASANASASAPGTDERFDMIKLHPALQGEETLWQEFDLSSDVCGGYGTRKVCHQSLKSCVDHMCHCCCHQSLKSCVDHMCHCCCSSRL
jgi:hypothetical protein